MDAPPRSTSMVKANLQSEIHTVPLDAVFDAARGGWVERGTQVHEAQTPSHWRPGTWSLTNMNLHNPRSPPKAAEVTVGGHMKKFDSWRERAHRSGNYVNPFASRGILQSALVSVSYGEAMQMTNAKAAAQYAGKAPAAIAEPAETAPGTAIHLRGGWPVNSLPPPPHTHNGPRFVPAPRPSV